MANSKSWKKIFKDSGMESHDFSAGPFVLTASDIKKSVQKFKKTAEKEVRILCKQDTREQRPDIFVKNDLFLLPKKNGTYYVVQGDGYIDIPPITSEPEIYRAKIGFNLDTAVVGNSEMQHLDYAYAVSLIRTFMEDESLVLTIRGRKYTPSFSFKVGKQLLSVESVQTEVDAGYEGKDKIVLIEAKGSGTKNTIIRQLFYPFKQWGEHTNKKISTLFFEKNVTEDTFSIWEFRFLNVNDYNSIELVKSKKYKII